MPSSADRVTKRTSVRSHSKLQELLRAAVQLPEETVDRWRADLLPRQRDVIDALRQGTSVADLSASTGVSYNVIYATAARALEPLVATNLPGWDQSQPASVRTLFALVSNIAQDQRERSLTHLSRQQRRIVDLVLSGKPIGDVIDQVGIPRRRVLAAISAAVARMANPPKPRAVGLDMKDRLDALAAAARPAQFAAALRALSPKQRILLGLTRAGKSPEAIATEIGVSRASVLGSRWHAYLRLRQAILDEPIDRSYNGRTELQSLVNQLGPGRIHALLGPQLTAVVSGTLAGADAHSIAETAGVSTDTVINQRKIALRRLRALARGTGAPVRARLPHVEQLTQMRAAVPAELFSEALAGLPERQRIIVERTLARLSPQAIVEGLDLTQELHQVRHLAILRLRTALRPHLGNPPHPPATFELALAQLRTDANRLNNRDVTVFVRTLPVPLQHLLGMCRNHEISNGAIAGHLQQATPDRLIDELGRRLSTWTAQRRANQPSAPGGHAKAHRSG